MRSLATNCAEWLVAKPVLYCQPWRFSPVTQLENDSRLCMIRASCKSPSVIYMYLITCRRCGQQDIGEIGQPLHCRMNGHRSDILHRRAEVSPMATHLNSDSHSQADTTVMVIDRVNNPDSCLCKTWESRWIWTLRTSSPLGINLWVDSL